MSNNQITGQSTCAANTAASARIDLPPGELIEVSVNEVTSGTGAWVKFGDNTVAAAVGTASTAAVSSLTLTGVANTTETVTIGTTVYTWKTALTVPAVPYEVLIGANAAASVVNLVKAIMDTGTEGTHYGTGTVIHPTVSAIDDTGDVVTITAKTPGTAGNSIATTETSTNMSWTSTTMASGADGSETSLYLPVRVPKLIRRPSNVTHMAAIGVGANAVVSVVGMNL